MTLDRERGVNSGTQEGGGGGGTGIQKHRNETEKRPNLMQKTIPSAILAGTNSIQLGAIDSNADKSPAPTCASSFPPRREGRSGRPRRAGIPARPNGSSPCLKDEPVCAAASLFANLKVFTLVKGVCT